jgi:magnesium transporter
MIRSLVFTTQGRLHSKDIEMFLMPTLLSDTNLFLWVDLESPTPEENKYVLEDVFHFHPLSIEDCVTASPSPKVDEYSPKEEDHFTPYLFIVIHAVDYSRKDGVFATSELNFFLGRNFLITYHAGPLRSVSLTEERAVKATTNIARAPDRVAHNLLDSIVDNYKPALDELSLEIAEIEQLALQHPTKDTLNKIMQVKKEVLHLRKIIGPQRVVDTPLAENGFTGLGIGAALAGMRPIVAAVDRFRVAIAHGAPRCRPSTGCRRSTRPRPGDRSSRGRRACGRPRIPTG